MRRDSLGVRTNADDMALASERISVALREIGNIRNDGGTQMRADLNPETVQEYAYSMREGNLFPPIIVFYDGETHWLGDGFHRLAAHKLAKPDQPIPCDVRPGTRRDAVLCAAGANAVHGLRRTNADKRRAVETLLRDEEWGVWSDREIARRCHVSGMFVGNVRGDILTVNGLQSEVEPSPAPAPPAERIYTTRHGTQATMNTTGQREAAQQRKQPAPAPPGAPAAAPSAGSGQASGRCEVCHHPMTDPRHIAAGCGPVCAAKREIAAGGFVAVEAAFESSYSSAGQEAANYEADDDPDDTGVTFKPLALEGQRRRNELIQELIRETHHYITRLAEYSKITGDHTGTIAIERGLRALVSKLEGNLV